MLELCKTLIKYRGKNMNMEYPLNFLVLRIVIKKLNANF